MQWSDTIKEHIDALKPVKTSQALIQRIMPLVDLTSLNESDTEASIAAMMEKITSPFGHVAAVCVYPPFVRLAAASTAGTPVKVATVANFPQGESSLENVLLEIGSALQSGAEEIDVVFPYRRYLAGERHFAETFVSSCKAACGDQVTLKVILETGALGDASIIADASFDALTHGADFIKTSTGKLAEGASLEAAATMLLVIHHLTPKLNRRMGIKISGGIRELPQAAQYVALADSIMGREWVTADTFRIGASKLVDEMLKSV